MNSDNDSSIESADPMLRDLVMRIGDRLLRLVEYLSRAAERRQFVITERDYPLE